MYNINNKTNQNTTKTLKFLAKYTIIEESEVLEILAMNKDLQKAKEMHPYEIHHTEKSGWFTEVDDSTQPTGKRKVRRCSEESLWKALVAWYIDNSEKNINLKNLYVK
ncbi:MAG: hypothetical protein LUK37_03670 [Clostridia bacterium]|nr:hypothetical protein [Clostridia bacterium]